MGKTRYVPALILRWLTPLYDALVAGPMSAIRMKNDLLAGLGDLSGKSVLDLGCVTGLDGDPRTLEIARRKARGQGVVIRFSEAVSDSMLHVDASFDCVTTTLMLHHLSSDSKHATATEM